jgi:hypothetical protein
MDIIPNAELLSYGFWILYCRFNHLREDSRNLDRVNYPNNSFMVSDNVKLVLSLLLIDC